MNSLLVASAAKGAKNIMSNKYVLATIITIIGLLVFKSKIKKAIAKYREGKFDKNETKDVNQIAQQYRSASNPSGIAMLINTDGTNEEAIDRLAYQTKGSFEAVADAYKLKFDETLTDRMRKELDADEFQDWKNIID